MDRRGWRGPLWFGATWPGEGVRRVGGAVRAGWAASEDEGRWTGTMSFREGTDAV